MTLYVKVAWLSTRNFLAQVRIKLEPKLFLAFEDSWDKNQARKKYNKYCNLYASRSPDFQHDKVPIKLEQKIFVFLRFSSRWIQTKNINNVTVMHDLVRQGHMTFDLTVPFSGSNKARLKGFLFLGFHESTISKNMKLISWPSWVTFYFKVTSFSTWPLLYVLTTKLDQLCSLFLRFCRSTNSKMNK